MRDQGDSAFQWLKAHDMFEGVNLLHKATQHLLSLDTEKAGFIAMPYLNLFGVVAGHVALQKQMEVIDTHHDPKFIKQKKDIADFYHKNILPRAQTEFAIIMQG
jgi:hypothetical protein